MAEEKVRLRSRDVEGSGEGSYGYERFKIERGIAEVSRATAQGLLTSQPHLWTEVKTKGQPRLGDQQPAPEPETAPVGLADQPPAEVLAAEEPAARKKGG